MTESFGCCCIGGFGAKNFLSGWITLTFVEILKLYMFVPSGFFCSALPILSRSIVIFINAPSSIRKRITFEPMSLASSILNSMFCSFNFNHLHGKTFHFFKVNDNFKQYKSNWCNCYGIQSNNWCKNYARNH